MPIKKTRPRGFSLIELLLVLTLSPIVFFAVYSNFAMGVKLWQRLQVQSPEEDLVIFSLKAQRDLANAMRLSTIPFIGEPDAMTFASAIEAPEALGGKDGIGQVRYFYDERARAVMRETQDYSQTFKQAPGQKTLLIGDVDEFQVSYLAMAPTATLPDWTDSFASEKPTDLPIAVRFTYSRAGTRQRQERTYFLAAGGAKK
jgi:prepilin-type N-terminal cleavage/methylation domain-containing protein